MSMVCPVITIVVIFIIIIVDYHQCNDVTVVVVLYDNGLEEISHCDNNCAKTTSKFVPKAKRPKTSRPNDPTTEQPDDQPKSQIDK